ncbi:efflux RND transporter periplasmic adaptor subunit [Janthinobacterium sp. PC23-8]|uniref:efflux RND transporter periplasmic adaptor subunit n=1 Tax=Janthinobacterium sp. PC23-8 TaxID=2012679 RepID=UPI000B97521C|nr:efflux RND transporter periplasmic adaptor subunit [Janthinobacterium sp. PC23-8]OYO32023.1 efflux transporter periplasmic adaptor subunit [Janthinobacterium sp. PC23-8]
MNITLSKKQLLAIVAILVTGLVLAFLILGSGASRDEHASEEEQHGHAEEKSAPPVEGLLLMSTEQSKAAGVAIATAAPGRIQTSVALPGEIRFNEDRTAHVVPRLAGVVEAVHADLGQLVKKGQVLAVIASTDLSERRSELLSAQRRLSLARATYEREKMLWQEKISAELDYLQARQAWQEADIAVQNAQQKLQALGAMNAGKGPLNRYEIRAPFDAMVLEKHITLGEAVKEDANIFVISDLSTVWAEIAVPARDLATVRMKGKVLVKASAFNASAKGTITYVGALLGEQTRTAKARISLQNPDMAWRPGLFVSVEVIAGEQDAPVTVQSTAIQSVEDKPSVFVQVKHGYQATPVTPGRSDGQLTEITQGLAAGTPYAAQGSFTLKSELGKASAGHEH